jgi:hypothetical protein
MFQVIVLLDIFARWALINRKVRSSCASVSIVALTSAGWRLWLFSSTAPFNRLLAWTYQLAGTYIASDWYESGSGEWRLIVESCSYGRGFKISYGFMRFGCTIAMRQTSDCHKIGFLSNSAQSLKALLMTLNLTGGQDSLSVLYGS